MKNKFTLEELNEMMDESGGSLYLRDTQITALPEGLTVGGYLDLENCTKITALPEGLTVGGYLDLRDTQITALPEGLTVGGYLDLRDTQITALPEGLTVGGSLDLENCTQITALPEGLTVGGYLDLRDTQITNDGKYHRLREGDFVDGKYIYCDGMLTHISRKKVFGQYTYFVGKIKGQDVIYDGEFYAHCKSFEDGVRDLSFKRAKDRGQDQYKDMTLDSVVKHDDAIVMYRIITGACQAGTNRFLDGLEQHKEEYTIREIIELTRGQYGSGTFEAFFKKEE